MNKHKYLHTIFLLSCIFTSLTVNLCFKFSEKPIYAHAASATKIRLNQTRLSLFKGERKTLKLVNSKGSVVWKSSNNKVASVSTKGVVTAVAPGSATITGTLDKKKYICTVTIDNPVISKSNASLLMNDTFILTISGTSRKAYWVTDNYNVASVSPTGQVVAVAPGRANITGIIDNFNFICSIIVETPSINISQNTIRPGDFFELEVKYNTVPVQWMSTDPSVAIVSNEGMVVGVTQGVTTIIATAGNRQFGCVVSVESLAINRSSLLLDIGQIAYLQIIGATEPVVWTSTNPKIATVDISGNITAIAPGKVNIIGAIAGKNFVCSVTVDGLTLSCTSASLAVDDSLQLSVIGTDLPIEWQSSNEDVADVEDGLVYAYEAGTTNISAIIGNRKLNCIITVTP